MTRAKHDDVDDLAPVDLVDAERRTERLRKLWVPLTAIVAVVLSGSAQISSRDAARDASNAAAQARTIAECVNRSLAVSRELPSGRTDNQAARAWVASLDAVLSAPKADVERLYVQFQDATATYKSTLNSNQAYRDANPTGAC